MSTREKVMAQWSLPQSVLGEASVDELIQISGVSAVLDGLSCDSNEGKLIALSYISVQERTLYDRREKSYSRTKSWVSKDFTLNETG